MADKLHTGIIINISLLVKMEAILLSCEYQLLALFAIILFKIKIEVIIEIKITKLN